MKKLRVLIKSMRQGRWTSLWIFLLLMIVICVGELIELITGSDTLDAPLTLLFCLTLGFGMAMLLSVIISERNYNNRANVQRDAANKPVAEDTTLCETCNEVLTFAMRDNFHEFSVGLSTILECLQVAEQQGYVPPLPAEWWQKVN